MLHALHPQPVTTVYDWRSSPNPVGSNKGREIRCMPMTRVYPFGRVLGDNTAVICLYRARLAQNLKNRLEAHLCGMENQIGQQMKYKKQIQPTP